MQPKKSVIAQSRKNQSFNWLQRNVRQLGSYSRIFYYLLIVAIIHYLAAILMDHGRANMTIKLKDFLEIQMEVNKNAIQ